MKIQWESFNTWAIQDSVDVFCQKPITMMTFIQIKVSIGGSVSPESMEKALSVINNIKDFGSHFQ